MNSSSLNAGQIILFTAMAVIGVLFVAGWRRCRSAMAPRPAPGVADLLTGFIVAIGDTLGIGSFAPTTAIFKLRKAVAERRATIVELINYRKDGTPFRNAVMIAPLFDEAGELQYFLGSQMEVERAGESRHDRARARIAALSKRQREILEGLAGGALNKQIAYTIGVTERTVKMHRAALQKALGVRTVADAIRLAIEAGY